MQVKPRPTAGVDEDPVWLRLSLGLAYYIDRPSWERYGARYDGKSSAIEVKPILMEGEEEGLLIYQLH